MSKKSKWLKNPTQLKIPNLYQSHSGVFIYLFKINGVKRRRELDATTKTTARDEALRKQSMHDKVRNGLEPPEKDPFAEQSVVALTTVDSLYAAWEDAGYPDFKNDPHPYPTSDAKEYQIDYLKGYGRILEFFGKMEAESIRLKHCTEFFTWRTLDMRRGKGHRTVDIAINCLSSLLNWAREKDLIEINPIYNRKRYQKGEDVTHCTEFMCSSAEELHTLCGHLINQERSKHCALISHNARAAVGWKLLAKAYLGGRNQETEAYRMDAKRNQPGWQDWAMKQMFHERAKGGRNPWVMLEPWEGCQAVYNLFAAHRAWHIAAYSNQDQYGCKVPWMFPDRNGEQVKPKSSHASNTLIKACKELKIERRTQHGMRAYHVAALRSQGILDEEIANRLGHNGGPKLVDQIYGECRSGFRGSKTLGFEPEDRSKLAYAQWLPESQAHSQAHFLSASG